jgi:hypothetical protein
VKRKEKKDKDEAAAERQRKADEKKQQRADGKDARDGNPRPTHTCYIC